MASQFLLAVVSFHGFVILHECGHQSASSNSFLNTLTGHWCSLFCFMPYFPWKYIHAEHHLYAGNLDLDPTLKGVRDYREQPLKGLVFQLAWRTWIPLLAFVQHLVLWNYPLMLFKLGQLKGRRLTNCLISITFVPMVYLALHAVFPRLFVISNFALALVIYLVIVELVNFPHHLGTNLFRSISEEKKKLALWEQSRVTRSCYYPPIISELLFLNFNFHIEHHFFPTLPWFHLRRARKLLRQALGNEYEECITINWNLHNRRKDFRGVFLKGVSNSR
jgi:fatty acid desaturase